MPPLPPKVRPKFFHGNSDDLDGLHDQIDGWLAESKVLPVNVTTSNHFDAETKKWNVLVTVFYQNLPEVAGPQIFRPTLTPRRVD